MLLRTPLISPPLACSAKAAPTHVHCVCVGAALAGGQERRLFFEPLSTLFSIEMSSDWSYP